MRILNLSFQNINSLAGEGRIDFDQGPIAESGVFAITGPNGSGKTSILDVITLALYGETFRFSKPAEHVISKHTESGYAQVEFSIAGEKYRALWQANRDSNALPNMQLSHLQDQQWQLIAENPNTVRQQLADISGMDFHRFSKSMVLPQGDFAAFLNALDSERMDILEKISGADLYANYRQQFEGQLPAIQSKVGQLEQEMALIPVLPSVEIESAEADLHDFTEQAESLKQELASLQNQQLQFANLLALQQQRQQLSQQQQAISAQIATLESQRQRLEQAPATDQLQSELQILSQKQLELEEQQRQFNQLQTELAQLQQQLPDSGQLPRAELKQPDLLAQKQTIETLRQQVSTLKQQLPQQTELQSSIQQQLADKQYSLSQLSALDVSTADRLLIEEFPDVVQLRNLRNQIADLQSQLKTQQKQTKTSDQASKKNQTAIHTTQSRIAALELQIEQQQQQLAELAPGKSIDDLQQLQTEQRERVKDIQELINIAELNQRLSKKAWYDFFTPAPKLISDDEADLQQKISGLDEEISREENIAKVLERAMANDNLLRKMAKERSKLVDGQPCHLCGSTEHPYAHKLPSFNDAKLALVDQRSKVSDLKSKRQNLNSQLKALQRENTQSEAKQRFLDQKRSDWNILANRLNILGERLDINHIGPLKKRLQEENDDLSRINNLIRDVIDIQRSISKAQTEISAKQQLLLALQQESRQFLPMQEEQPQEAANLEQQLSQLETELKTLTTQLEKQLTALGEKLPSKGKENAVFDRLNTRRQDLQINALRQQGLSDEIEQLRQQLQNTQQTIIDFHQQLSQAQDALQGEEALGLHLAILEKQQLIRQQQQQLDLQRMEFEAMQALVYSHITAAGFGGLEDLQAFLTLKDRQAEILQQYQNYQQQLQTLQQQLSSLDANIQDNAAGLEQAIQEEELQRLIQQLTQQLDIAQQEIDTLSHKLDKQQQYRLKYQTLEDELLHYYRQLAQVQGELEQLNNTPGGLRAHVKQLLIDKLLSEANRILEKINGRYYLRTGSSDHGLALEIEDTRQNNIRRQPKTLSGGESFVVSLSLALALAEIANNGQSVESLFLDEGFGNLDAESLYLAMGALEGLSIQGKTVGVISHVDGVKKRIKTQIELVKKPDGFSELKWVA